MNDLSPLPVPTPGVTLKQIAAHLGLSVSTVARCLRNDRHRISADTVARVRQAARDLGYVRNLDGLRLRTGRSMTLLAVLGTAEDDEVGDPGSDGLLNGMQKRLAGSDYVLASKPILLHDRSPERLAAILRNRPCDGVVIDHIEPGDPRIALLGQMQIPFITFGRPAPDAPHPWFEIDNIHAAHQGTAALIARGHRRIALIEAAQDLNFARERVEGYRRALAEAGLAFDPALVRHMPTSAGLIRQNVRDLATSQNPDAYLCSNEIFLIATLAACRDAARRPLETTGLAFRGATNLGAYLGLPLIASHYPRQAVGFQLADLLLRRLQGAPLATLQRLVRCDLRQY